jgi:ribosomal protein S12 methylthiotransferase accessory factor
VPTPVVTSSGHARTFEETEAWLAPKLSRVPITRVFDASPLDSLRLPVWSAVTPLAKDLTVHSGKGGSAKAARLSAIMEAIERVSAEAIPWRRLWRASYRTLVSSDRVSVVEPTEFDLPFETVYTPGRLVTWVSGWDLLVNERVWVAADLVVSPAIEGVCVGTETNGLASGNTHTEATLHALYELIERDAVAQADYREIYGHDDALHPTEVDTIDAATVPGRSAELIAQIQGLGLRVQVRQYAHETGVPVFGVRAFDRWFPAGPMEFEGFGASREPADAVFRAVTEAVQSHTTRLLGNRDEYEEEPGGSPGAPAARRAWFDRSPKAWRYPSPRDAHPHGDILIELRSLLERLLAVGFRRCIVVDLTNEYVDVPVVRVLVPGLAHPYGLSRRRPSVRLLRQFV